MPCIQILKPNSKGTAIQEGGHFCGAEGKAQAMATAETEMST